MEASPSKDEIEVKYDLSIPKLGEARYDSPLKELLTHGDHDPFIGDGEKIVFDPALQNIESHVSNNQSVPALELAGPRSRIFFDPKQTTAAIVTCGGLCPGLNDVIRSLVWELYHRYGVTNILGIRSGYQGMSLEKNIQPMELYPELVDHIHKEGGTILGTSRGTPGAEDIVDFLVEKKIDIFFTIGGDGTLRGALSIAEEAKKRNLPISVVGIPKTIDNDILHIDHSFGFETAFAKASESVTGAHNESKASPNGIGLVKLMGRHSGFVACLAALAMSDVNFVLIPEQKFALEGEKGFLAALKKRIEKRGHAVVVVAEGAGQDLLQNQSAEKDQSGNIKFGDIGSFLKSKITEYFESQGMESNVKYIDPSYIIRSVPASPYDSAYCLGLAQNAVHAAMSGRTRIVIGRRINRFVHFPMEIIASGKQHVDLKGTLWRHVLSATGQPPSFV